MGALRRFLPTRLGMALAFVASLLLGLVVSFAVDRARSAGTVLRGVTVGGLALGGLDRPLARERLEALRAALRARRVDIVLQQHRFGLTAADLGWTVDPARHVDRAWAAGRSGSGIAQLGWWVARLVAPEELSLEEGLDRQVLEPLLAAWERERIEPRAFAGTIVAASPLQAEYPREGLVVDRAELERRIQGALASEHPRLEVPLIPERPALSRQDVDRALARARELTGAPLALSVPPVPDAPPERPEVVVFSPEELREALRTEVQAAPPALAVTLDGAALARRLEAERPRVEIASRDATFRIDARQQVHVMPAARGVRLDDTRLVEHVLAAARSPERRAELPVVETEPALDTPVAEALGIKQLVARFTTHHNCCEPRVKNIHLIADLLDGVVVRPGETFSVNEYVGPRTEARGFVLAPTIVEGDMDRTVGGGISQFATTLFNAVFDGGYEIVQRQPHSFYFPRYPVGHEATLSYPSPDLIFKNDTNAALLIKTEYGDKFIRVLLYGDNGGRRVARKVGPRIERTAPPLEYVPNPGMSPHGAKLERRGVEGWSVEVVRTITFPDGTRTEQQRKVTYNPRPRVVQVHPCNIPRGKPGYTGEPCPEPVRGPDGGAPAVDPGLLSLEALSR
jgi:vancomycin resistance protein YoaR